MPMSAAYLTASAWLPRPPRPGRTAPRPFPLGLGSTGPFTVLLSKNRRPHFPGTWTWHTVGMQTGCPAVQNLPLKAGLAIIPVS